MNSESPNRQSPPARNIKSRPGMLQAMAPYLTMGFQLAAAVLLFFFLGHWIDTKYNIAPIGKLVGVVIGCTGGFIKFFKSAASLAEEEEQRRAKEKRED